MKSLLAALTLFESNAQAASQKSRQYQFDADSTKLTGAVANSDTLFQAVQDLSRLVAALLQHPLNHLIWMQIETLVQYLILVPLSFKFGVGVSVGDETLDLDDGLDYDLDLMNQLNFDPSVAILSTSSSTPTASTEPLDLDADRNTGAISYSADRHTGAIFYSADRNTGAIFYSGTLSFSFGGGTSVGETLNLDDGLDYGLGLMNQLNFDPSVAIIERAAEYWFDYDTDVLPSTHIVEVLGLHKLANGSLAENVIDDGLDYGLGLMNQLNFDPSVAIIERAAENWFDSDYDTDLLLSTIDAYCGPYEFLGLHKLADGSLADNVYDLKHCRTEAILPTINIQRIIPYRAGTDHLLLDLDKPSAPIELNPAMDETAFSLKVDELAIGDF
eukprot:CAMPEP_0197323360 /NCGR_PEP_ID=MMETSP0891-20130614/70469_1 /TAXON_ID=44058 ORGANISM="Aureoumbra lagunensis, Strain CCMP1510" /NCGR_SAMPLE_ID=MMETSP0891 /ASSEMBLY_ACC=CAM_ASM_000534 /LENGTH=386 /DNA_ID=CAMNT_0042815989 /DNA_START=471 /DNA_END=1629 /DNA_ORIENTATION=-